MRDPRIDKWADVLVHYSLETKPGQHVFLVGDPAASPLLEACYEKFIQAGTHVECFLLPASWSEIAFKHSSEEQLRHTPPIRLYGAQTCDLYLYVGATHNSKALCHVDPKKQSMQAQALQPILNAILDRAAKQQVKWCYAYFPTAAAAQDAELSTLEYEEFVFRSASLHQGNPIQSWKAFATQQQNLIDFLSEKKELRFQNEEGTDLLVNIEGMKWVNCCGKINFPDGEVYTGPNLQAKDGGVHGVVRTSLPTVYLNVEVCDIELTFEKGAVVEAKASKGQNFLREMIAQDPGAKYVGEIAIGTNYEVNRCTKNILFDEKIGGTFHLALGKGYPQTGNVNQSALHWDIIFDLRQGGKILADDHLILKDGKFVTSV